MHRAELVLCDSIPAFAGTASDNSKTFSYNQAQQISSRTQSNDGVYAWTNHYNVTRPYGSNGLNQYSYAGPTSASYDKRGNISTSGTASFGYDVENRLTSVGGASTMTLGYDARGRLASTTVSGTGVTQFLYDGDALVGEYNASGTLLRRYVHGSGVDEPLVWYEGAALSDRRHLHADERGSIVAVSDAGGNASSSYAYGPYGEPGVWPGVRFRYTGQIVLPEVGLYHYKARAYSPRFGRFLQSDPIGTRDDMNMYAYVGNDPVNGSDPSGLANTGYSDSSFSLTGGTQLAENVAAPAFGAGVTYTDVGRGLLTAGNIIVDAVSTAAAATVAGVGAVGAILLYPNTTADPAHDEYHGGGTIMNADKPPSGSLPIDQTPWSGDHQEIKSGIGARPTDNVRISPTGEVWVQNPNGSWTNEGPAGSYTGSGEPSGKRGKDR